jgi:hypothetical protein
MFVPEDIFDVADNVVPITLNSDADTVLQTCPGILRRVNHVELADYSKVVDAATGVWSVPGDVPAANLAPSNLLIDTVAGKTWSILFAILKSAQTRWLVYCTDVDGADVVPPTGGF